VFLLFQKRLLTEGEKRMKCPVCGCLEDKVIESRQSAGGDSIRRRRMCMGCNYRFTSYEHIEEKKLMIVKKDKRREEFSEEKLSKGVYRAFEKRSVPPSVITKLINDIGEQCVILAGESHEIDSSRIGELVMDKLQDIDMVAYIRFASVYRQFDDVKEFIREIKRIKK